MLPFLTRTAGFLVLAALLFTPVALAQDTGQQAPPDVEDVDPTDEELDAVAEVFLILEEIQADFEQEFAQAESAEEFEELQQELQERETEAIEEHGEIEPERYREIILVAQQDPDLRDDLLTRIEELREETS